MARGRATELEFLKWFYQRADFGQAHSYVMGQMAERFMDETGKNLPERYNYSQDGERVLDRHNCPRCGAVKRPGEMRICCM